MNNSNIVKMSENNIEDKTNDNEVKVNKICDYTKTNMFYFIIIFIILFFPIFISEYGLYDISIKVPFLNNIRYNYFGIISVLYFFGKILFSVLNFYKMKKINNTELNEFPSVGIQVTGWREDKKLFKNTLLSMKYQSYKNIKKITFCSDGNEKEDEYLGEIFKEVFPNSLVYKLDKTFYNLNKKERKDFLNRVKNHREVCILQPHAGKRHGMYTQMKIYNSMNDIDLIMLNDSDCIYNNEAIDTLVKSIVHENVDAVTGDVKIYNIENLTSYLISLKFWYAFNFERNAQSYFKCVGCVPGPFGLYKNKTINKIIDVWIEQKLFGKECTFGDDRHLTNLILKNHGKVTYNYKAKCYTDTPTSIQRFATQQTRWGKSFLREYFVNINSFRWNTLWLGFEQTFVFFIVYYVMYILIKNYYNMNLNNILLIYVSLILFGFIRSFFAIISTKKFDFIIFPLYGFLYIYILFPVKLWTLFTFNITSWGTGNRLNKSFKLMDFLFIVIWFLFTNSCLIYSFITNEYDIYTYIYVSFIFLSMVCLFLMYRFYFLKKVQNEFKKELNQILNFNKEEIEVELSYENKVIINMEKVEQLNIEL